MDRSDDIIRHNIEPVFDAEALKVALGVSSRTSEKLEELAKANGKRACLCQVMREINYFRRNLWR